MMHASAGVPGMAYYSYSAQNSPAVDTANKENPFDSLSVSIPPRLKNIGRKISQMSNDFLPPGITPEEESALAPATAANSSSNALEKKKSIEVPGMGDEPVMCPFCNKPLPPSLFAAQLTTHSHQHQHQHQYPNRPGSVRRSSSMRVSSPSPRLNPTPSAPLSRVPSANTPPTIPTPLQSSKSLLDALPVVTPEIKTVEPALPSATSESFAETVKEGDVANHDAAENMITEDEIKRWSSLSGISIPISSSSSTSAPTQATEKKVPKPTPKPIEEKKAFPLLPPPPPAANKLTKASPSERPSSTQKKFHIFSKGGKDDDDEESDDDNVVSGYTKLTAPGSPSDSEGEEGLKKRIGGKKEDGKKEVVEEIKQKESKPGETAEKEEEKTETGQIPSPGSAYTELAETQQTVTTEASAEPNEVKKVLQEVLARVNELSKSQTALLASHSTLLTSLKIARSNLAMAEANSEMLEEQLKRTSASSRTGTSRNISGPTTTPGTPQLTAPAPRASADHVRATTTSNAMASPAAVARTPARASLEERSRPVSLQITATDLANAGSMSGPQSSGGYGSSTNSNSWGFWNGGKKKVTGALSHVHVPSASTMINAMNVPSRPGTPNIEGYHPRVSSEQPSRLPSTSPAAPNSVPLPAPRPQPTRTVTHQANLSKSFNEQPSLSRSMSVMNVPAQRAASTNLSVTNSELAKLRQAYSAAVAKMDGMSKELVELKQGKVDMEAELENLSQALFEEANKMVADERRKRAELEESFKEVKEEREALKETIKVLGGNVPEPDESTDIAKEDEEVDQKVAKKEEGGDKFAPRDLDKHYEALSKAIHHVSSGADLTEQRGESDGQGQMTAEPIPLTPSLSSVIGLEIPPLSKAIAQDRSRGEPQPAPGFDMQQISMSLPSLPAENNPWINSSPPKVNVKAATPSPQPISLAEVPNDTSGEGESPAGLGFEMDLSNDVGEVGERKAT
ncbi:uncharacterized protein IL334_000941 [Kwoniella shivajii]|uniref:GDP/GTP exchange factor Sec2 N-terminal domain-containing protein n=1 Tax=Kwoniella shivajii TaxID=564305 RepID=A0ABZ1CQK0_9TREE|nr:hypothetical protein IL334_000941 [Kwoniella shivajii]